MKIAIKFHDNDFFHTFTGVLKIFLADWLHRRHKYPRRDVEKGMFQSKTKVLRLVNELSLGAYLTFQNKFEYRCSEKEIEHIRGYLKLGSTRKILLGKEVDEFLAKEDWCNGEVFILDTDLGKDNPIYSI